MKPVKVRIEDLKLDPENVRQHGTENIDMIKKSLLENGQFKLLIVDEKSMIVKIGNGRLQAMRELGWTECWCLLVDFSKHEGMEVLDNRLNELSYWTDKSLDDWLLNDKGLDWWGVDKKKNAALSRKSKAERKENGDSYRTEGQGGTIKTEKALLCPCCGKPLHKVQAVML